MTADTSDFGSLPRYHRPTVDEILGDENVEPVKNIHDLAVPGFFESDDELEEFLRFYHEQRQAETR
ncbi:MAG TPA: hypothetical protein VGM10_05450 [Actinocrinis sp.]